MAVTQTSGDGYALYNGVKLPTLPDTDKTCSIIYEGSNSGTVYLYKAPSVFSKFNSGDAFVALGYPSETYILSDGSWLYSGSNTNSVFANVSSMKNGMPTWSSFDTYTDSSLTEIAFPATTPLPLDGMQVIEWDGDATGLTSSSIYYKVSDTALNKTELTNCVWGMTSGSTVGAMVGLTVTEGDGYLVTDYGILSALEDNTTLAGTTFAESGLYFSNIDSSYVHIIAYTPAAEEEQPKWQFNLQDFLSGVAAGAACRGVMPRKQPIAYLYNGVQLPGLPEVDRETYPNALIVWRYDGTGTNTKEYLLLLQDVKKRTSDGTFLAYYETGEFYIARNGTWENASLANTELLHIVWSNYDVLSEDKTEVYLAATDPLPVGKPITDPLSFMMGYQIGCRLRAQRVRKPIGYLYNGVYIAGELPEAEGYEYKMLVEYNNSGIYTMYCMTNPLVQTGNVLYPNKVSAPYLVCNASVDGYGEFSQKDSDLSIAAAYVPIWTNADIINADGSVYLTESNPVPVYGWETLFEGDVTTAESGDIATANVGASAQIEPHFKDGDILAVTYDGVKTLFTAQLHSGAYGTKSYYVGDLSLYTSSTAGAYGYFLGSLFSLGLYVIKLITPTPAGTHTLKIERTVM